MIRKAAIDIGTNSTRLLIADLDHAGKLCPVAWQERITRLGQGVDATGVLAPQAMQRVLCALDEYIKICTEYQTCEIIVFATSATRDSGNRAEFLNTIFSKTGIRCRLLSGDEEASLSFKGVMSDLETTGRFLVCDIGGGSTEFIFAADGNILFKKSIDVGSQRMTQRFLKKDPVTAQQISRLRFFLSDIFNREFADAPKNQSCVCVGGTATTLAMMKEKIDISEPEKAHRVHIEKSEIVKLNDDLMQKNNRERQSLTGLHPDRAPIILAGGIIIEIIMDFFELEQITVSIRDLLFGILLEDN